MINMILILSPTVFVAIKVINYGRWAGRQGNLRGAIGLYIMAVLTVLLPAGVYILNMLR